MRNKLLKTIGLVLLIAMMGTNTAFASEMYVGRSKSVDNPIEPRSRYLATAISEITNKGSGILHIYADFTSYSSVDWAQITIKLERTKSESEAWNTVKTYTYEFDVKNEADGRLTFGCADFDVSGLATNYYYRVTCTHKVKTPSGSYETKTSRTNGVLLTPYPDFRSLTQPN